MLEVVNHTFVAMVWLHMELLSLLDTILQTMAEMNAVTSIQSTRLIFSSP